MTTKRLFPRLGIVLGLALACTVSTVCGGGGSQAGATRERGTGTGVGPATIYVNNYSNEPIYYIYVSPANQDTWGNDLLGSNVLPVNSYFEVLVPSEGYWDIRVVDSSGNYKEWYGEYVQVGHTYDLDVDSQDWYR